MVERQRVADVLTGLGWCLLAGYLALVVAQVNDVREFNRDFAQSFAEQVASVARIASPISTVILDLGTGAVIAAVFLAARLAIRLEPLPPSRDVHPDHHGHHRPTSPFAQRPNAH